MFGAGYLKDEPRQLQTRPQAVLASLLLRQMLHASHWIACILLCWKSTVPFKALDQTGISRKKGHILPSYIARGQKDLCECSAVWVTTATAQASDLNSTSDTNKSFPVEINGFLEVTQMAMEIY